MPQTKLYLNSVPKGYVAWLYGLTASGKTTLAYALRDHYIKEGKQCCVLDGDELRVWLSADLGFSMADREKNTRRAADLAAHLVAQGWIVIVSLVNPRRHLRELARGVIGAESFREIYVECPLNVCAKRDIKGLYKRFSEGLIKGVAGCDLPFEPPLEDSGALTVNSSLMTTETMVAAVLKYSIIGMQSKDQRWSCADFNTASQI